MRVDPIKRIVTTFWNRKWIQQKLEKQQLMKISADKICRDVRSQTIALKEVVE